MSDVQTGAVEDARLVIEGALTNALDALAATKRERDDHLAKKYAADKRYADLLRAIAAYHRALGRNADGSERKARGAGKGAAA